MSMCMNHKKVTDEKTEMLEYHWLYEVKKWMIHGKYIPMWVKRDSR